MDISKFLTTKDQKKKEDAIKKEISTMMDDEVFEDSIVKSSRIKRRSIVILDDEDPLPSSLSEKPTGRKKNTRTKKESEVDVKAVSLESKIKRKKVAKNESLEDSDIKILTPEKPAMVSVKNISPQPKMEIDESPTKDKPKINPYLARTLREGPKMLHSRAVPIGNPSCLESCTFVVTGEMEFFSRDEIQDIIKRHGGRVTSAVSSRTSYLVIGREPGETKLAKACQLGVEQLDEESLYKMIEGSETAVNKPLDFDSVIKPSIVSPVKSSPKKTKLVVKLPVTKSSDSILWVDKYKPQMVNQIIGQQGAKSCVSKLMVWLKDWKSNRSKSKDSKNFFAAKENGSIFRAALISGPPGIGKSTSAHLVAKELGFSILETNASDFRNKTMLTAKLGFATTTRTINFSNLGSAKSANKENIVIIMDEVDGISGSQDRGGIQTLITFIKKSQVPIICICNDRNHIKIRSLANSCFDLRFYRPRLDQIKEFASRLCEQENLSICSYVLEQIIEAAGHDIRQVIHKLQMCSASSDPSVFTRPPTTAPGTGCESITGGQKDIKENSFEAIRLLLSASSHSSGNIVNQLMDYFFVDFSLMPLFVHENYLISFPQITNHYGGKSFKGMDQDTEVISRIANAAELIAEANLIDTTLHSLNEWSLLPTYGLISCVLPSLLCGGRLKDRLNFPKFLGRTSTTNKNARIYQELTCHLKKSCSASYRTIVCDYLPYIETILTHPLIDAVDSSSVDHVVEMLSAYDLTASDWRSFADIAGSTPELSYSGKSVFHSIPSKIKGALTRSLNKVSKKLPYAFGVAKKTGRARNANDVDEMEMGSDFEEDQDDDSPSGDLDPMVIPITATTKSTAASKKSSAENKSTIGAKRGRKKKVDE